MSLLGSALGRALAGGGRAAEEISNRYIDEQLAKQRAQALADIQHASVVRADEYTNSPQRRERLRGEQGKDLDAANAGALRGRTAEATDPALQGALTKNATERAAAETTARGTAEAEIAKKFGNDPLFLSAKRKVAQATHVDSAASQAQAELARMEIKDRQRLGQLYDALAGLEADTQTAPDEKREQARSVMSQITAIKSKNAPAGQRDPELDTEKVTEEITMPDGSVRKVERKQVRRPGAAKSDASGSDDPLGLRTNNPDTKRTATGAPALEAKPSVAGRRFMSWPAEEIQKKLGDRRLPFMERADLMRELELRKQGDISPS